MKTFHFFQIIFEPNGSPHPVTYSVSFHNSGGMLHDQSKNVPPGKFFSPKVSVIIDEQANEIPIIIHEDDPRLLTYAHGEAFCIASPNEHLIRLVYFWFCQGFNSGCKASLNSMQAYYDAHPIRKERP